MQFSIVLGRSSWFRWVLVVVAALVAPRTYAAEPSSPMPMRAEDLDELSIEELLDIKVVTATQTEQRLEEAPAIVTVVTGDTIRSWGYDSVADVLRHVTGFYVTDDHILANVGVRGISGGLRSESGLIKVMLDGHSVAFRSTAGNWIGPELVPLGAIERIEILRGPASALYGADAFLGVINIITKTGERVSGADMRLGANAIGRHAGGGEDITFGAKRGGLDLLLSLRLDTRNLSGLAIPSTSPAPKLPSYANADALTRGDRQGTASSFGKLTYTISERTKLTLSGWFSAFDRGAELADWTQLAYGIDSEGRLNYNRVSLAQGFANAALEWKPTDKLSLTAEATYFEGKPTARDHIEVGSDVYYVRRRFGFRGTELALAAHYQVIEDLSVLGRVDLVLDEERLPSVLQVLKASAGSQAAGTVREASSIRQGKLLLQNPGAHLQAIYTGFGKLLALTAGARFDHHSIYGNQLSTRIAGVSSPRDDLHLKLLYGSAFKAPSPLLLYAVPLRAGDLLGNPDLEAQQIHTVEGQVVYELGERVVISGDVAYSVLRNEAEFVLQDVNLVARNVAEVGSLSVEAELEARPVERLQTYLRASWQKTVRATNEEGYRAWLLGSEAGLYPAFLAHAGALYGLPVVPARVGVEASYVSSRRASDSNILEAGAPYSLDPYVLLGASVSTVGLELLEGHATEIRLVAQNLLDAAGPDPGFGGVDYPLTPRSFWLVWRQEI